MQSMGVCFAAEVGGVLCLGAAACSCAAIWSVRSVCPASLAAWTLRACTLACALAHLPAATHGPETLRVLLLADAFWW